MSQRPDLDALAGFGLQAIRLAMKKHISGGGDIGVVVILADTSETPGMVETAIATNMCPHCSAGVVKDLAEEMADEDCASDGIGHA
jgi:hypothetical protein